MPKTKSWGRSPFTPDSPEFQSRVEASIGAPYVGAVDPSRATQLPYQYAGLLGYYTHPKQQDFSRSIYGHLRDNGIPVEPDRVYIGDRDGTAQTWAHEFRHRASGGRGDYEEYSNRIKDAYYAQTERQWDEAIEMYRQFTNGESLQESEKELVAKLARNTISRIGGDSEEAKNARITGQDAYGPIDSIRGLLDPEWKDAVKKTNAPWRIWADQRGLLD